MIDSLLQEAKTIIIQNKERKSRATELAERIATLQADYTKESARLDMFLKSATLLGTVSDKSVDKSLAVIEDVINKALAVVFPLDLREIKLQKAMHNNAYPHFKAVLYAGVNRKERSFKFSGSGLGQVVSFLFTLSFIDTHKGRPIIIMDELMNGLHPSAKVLIRDMIKAVSNRFQFVIVEYGMDLGKEYLVERKGDYSDVLLYNGMYYRDISEQGAEDFKPF